MTYFVIENQIRADGIVNTSTTARSSFASGLSLWHDRCSKACLTELYPSVAVMLVDENLNVLRPKKNDSAVVETSYPKPVPPVEDAPAE